MAKSIVFDMNLLSSGSWVEEQKRLIENWIKEDEFEEKRASASHVISVMIPHLLGSDCSQSGRIKSNRLGEMLQHFEDLLETTKGGIAKKFYRDHLNHMLRVMLLANAIGYRVKAFSFSDQEIRFLTLAGLVHDIAYPLAESYHVLNDTIKAMKNCYSSLSFPSLLTSYDMERVTNLIEKLQLLDTPTSFFGPLLKANNHGVIGAIEFADYISKERLGEYAHLLRIIMFHDPSLSVPESLRKDLLLMALILSDEIQDWGRPAGLEKEPAISELTDFRIEPQKIQCNFMWESGFNVSPIRQIYAKVLNFKRFEWPSSLEISLLFRLQNYAVFNLETFDNVLEKAVRYCRETNSEILKKINEDWANRGPFEESFYGKSLPETDDLIGYVFDDRTLLQKSLYYDPKWNELLHTDREFGKLDSLRLEIKSGAIRLVLHGEKSESEGQLLSQQATKMLVEKIVARIVVFYRLTTEIAVKNGEKAIGPQVFPSTELVKKGLHVVDSKAETDLLIENLRGLRRSMVGGSLFAFISEK